MIKNVKVAAGQIANIAPSPLTIVVNAETERKPFWVFAGETQL